MNLQLLFTKPVQLFFFGLFLFCLPISIATINSSFYLLTVIILIQLIRDGIKGKKPNLNLLNWAVVVFILTQFLSVLFSPYSQKPARELIETIHPILYLLIAFFLARSPEIRSKLPSKMTFLNITVVIVGCYGIWQHWSGVDWAHGWNAVLPRGRTVYGQYRISGFFGHPLSFGYLYLFLLPFTALPFLNSLQQKRINWFHLIPFILCNLNIYFTLSRTALVVMVIEALIIISLIKKRYVLYLFIAASIVFFNLYFTHTAFRLRVHQMNPVTAKKNEFDRINFWKVHFQIFLDHPILGAGANNSKYLFNEYYKKYTKNTRRKYPAHNIYLQTLADSGALGFLSLMTLFFIFIWDYFKIKKGSQFPWKWKEIPPEMQITTLFLISVIGLLLGSLTQNTLKDAGVAVVFWFFLACHPYGFTQTEKTPPSAQ